MKKEKKFSEKEEMVKSKKIATVNVDIQHKYIRNENEKWDGR